MIQKLKDKLINVGGGSYDALINHINIQGDIINELIDKVNEIDNQSSKSIASASDNIQSNFCKAKSIKNNTWVDGYYIKYQPSASNNEWVEGIVPQYASDLYLIPILPETLCEFTGITIDDQRIYTGDLLQDKNGIYEVVREGHRFKCKGFYNSSYDVPDDAFSEEVSHLKLIGNKFDNPDLLHNR